VARLGGEPILDRAALDTIRRSLHSLSSVVVIRAGDLEVHGGGSPEDLEAARGLAATIRAGGAASVLLAGLGWRGRAIDLLDECGVVTVLDAPRLAAARVEGIAGAHAAALACHLARGLPLASAAAAAQRYVALRLQRGC
jgi:hydroxymethylpyrimidine/phosphomethylpyrimidine kinase